MRNYIKYYHNSFHLPYFRPKKKIIEKAIQTNKIQFNSKKNKSQFNKDFNFKKIIKYLTKISVKNDKSKRAESVQGS